MHNFSAAAACVQTPPATVTAPEATVIIIVLILAALLALAGLPSLSVVVLLVEATATGANFARRLTSGS